MIPKTMCAVLLTGHGGTEKLKYKTDVPVPEPNPQEVLIRVAAAGINNTDINTRIGWYSKQIYHSTDAGGTKGFDAIDNRDATWSGTPLKFPRIQGADVCGYIAAVGEGISISRVGERVLVKNMLRSYVNYRPYECWTLGSECDGGFAQFCVAPSKETYKINCCWTDIELAAIPCAYSTAENMLHRVNLRNEKILITGASGGVGSACVQLAKLRGAYVIALCSQEKSETLKTLGADLVFGRDVDLVAKLGEESVDIILDVVGGPQWPRLLNTLRRGGRYASAGAIAGPVCELDMRQLYLKDLTFFGCTFQEDIVFQNLVKYVEKDKFRPIIAKAYPLKEIVKAQEEFLLKKHTGQLVLIPPN